MSRWSLIVFAVVLIGPIGPSEGRVFHPCRTGFPASPSDGVASGDWSNGYEVDFAYAAVSPKAGGKGQSVSVNPAPGNKHFANSPCRDAARHTGSVERFDPGR